LDQNSNVIDNIHGIFAAAASHFSVEQFSQFSKLITVNWMSETESMKEKLLKLLGRIGRDTKNNELAMKVCKLYVAHYAKPHSRYVTIFSYGRSVETCRSYIQTVSMC